MFIFKIAYLFLTKIYFIILPIYLRWGFSNILVVKANVNLIFCEWTCSIVFPNLWYLFLNIYTIQNAKKSLRECALFYFLYLMKLSYIILIYYFSLINRTTKLTIFFCLAFKIYWSKTIVLFYLNRFHRSSFYLTF